MVAVAEQGSAISQFLYLLRWFLDGQALGWCLLATLTAVGTSVFRLLFRVVRRESGLRAVVWTWCTVVLSLALAGVRIALARQELLAVLLRHAPDDSSQRARLVAVSLTRVVLTQRFTCSVLAVAMLAMLVAVIHARPRLPQRWLIGLAASLLLLTVVAVHLSNQGFPWSCFGADNSSACSFEEASRSVLQMQRAARCLVCAGALGWAIGLLLVFRAARRQIVSDGRASLASTVILVAGIGAFWATRTEHADALQLVPPDRPNAARFWIDERLQEQLPMARSGCSAETAPIIELGANGVSVDGSALRDPEDVEAALARKRELWQQLNPASRFSGLVLLAAPRGTKAWDLLPWLLAAQQAGYAKFGALLQVPTATLHTHSLGALEIKRVCAEVWTIDAGLRRAFAHFETWGELVAADSVWPPDPYARHSEHSRCGSLSAPTSPPLASLFGKAHLLRKRDDLDALINQAKNGVAERLALRVGGTGRVSCECPPFMIPLSDPDESSPSLLAIPQNGAANFGLDRTVLEFIVVGYFSGAWIDTYEYLHTQGDDDPVTDDETRSTYRELGAEFCLEASCYWATPFEFGNYEHAGAEERRLSEENVRYWRTRQAEDIAQMARLGIPKCRPESLAKAR